MQSDTRTHTFTFTFKCRLGNGNCEVKARHRAPVIIPYQSIVALNYSMNIKCDIRTYNSISEKATFGITTKAELNRRLRLSIYRCVCMQWMPLSGVFDQIVHICEYSEHSYKYYKAKRVDAAVKAFE